MAWAQGTRRYFYIVESQGDETAVRQVILEYLGRDPDQKKLKRAMKYWRVESSK